MRRDFYSCQLPFQYYSRSAHKLAVCVQLVLLVLVDYRLPKHISAHIKREKAAAKGDALAPIYTESTVMSPVRREQPDLTDSARVDIQNPLFKDEEGQNPHALDAAAAHHDSTVASIATGGSYVEAPMRSEQSPNPLVIYSCSIF
jgi:hypothetical protein